MKTLRTLRHLAPGHPTGYRRVLSRAPWSGLALGCSLAGLLIRTFVPDGPVVLGPSGKRWLADEAAKNMRSQTSEIVLALKEKMGRQAETKKGSVTA